MTDHTPLKPDQLRRRCSPENLGFETTQELEPVDGLIGQSRALSALNFGVDLEAAGYNIFILGTPASGRHNAVREFLRSRAAEKRTPDDWLYVYNFDEPHRPRALNLPTGRGRKLAHDLRSMLDSLKTTMPAVFDSEDYQARRKAIDEQFRASQEQSFASISEKAESQSLQVVRTQTGLAVVPVRDGKILEPGEFEQLPENEQEDYQKKIAELQNDIRTAMENVPRLDKERREQIRELNRNLAGVAVGQAVGELVYRYGEFPRVREHLEKIRVDLIDNAQLFVRAAEQLEMQDGGTPQPELPLDVQFNRYKANLLVSHTSDGMDPDEQISTDDSNAIVAQGAPVIFEDSPGLGHLLGRIEHVPHMGAMLSDFTLIKSGDLHLANGGYLIIDAERLLSVPLAWQALKRCLRSQSIAIESPMTGISTTIAVTLEPEPIPLDAKILLIGQRETFYLLSQLDPDFPDLFKVAADFSETIEWQADTIGDYARLIAGIGRRQQLRPISADAVAAVIEHSARIVRDSEKLTLQVGLLSVVLKESDYWAGEEGSPTLKRSHVTRAVHEQIYRLDRIREQMHEQITRDTILIATDGAEVGQINGLSVLQIGSFSFGKPTRITARTRMGTGELVDIEREVNLGGPLHSKGVLILSGFLSARYVPDLPVSLRATLVFEQSYGGVDGDSASSTELYAILSSLADVPIRQDLAVTGSVNQNGEVQAIGGVNEKIEGYFDICKARGLTGKQGVLIPDANVKHLMLREDVVKACNDGQFHVYAVAHIDQGIEILTGKTSGMRDEDGQFPRDSINQLVEDRLRNFAEARRQYFTSGEKMGAGMNLSDYS